MPDVVLRDVLRYYEVTGRIMSMDDTYRYCGSTAANVIDCSSSSVIVIE